VKEYDNASPPSIVATTATANTVLPVAQSPGEARVSASIFWNGGGAETVAVSAQRNLPPSAASGDGVEDYKGGKAVAADKPCCCVVM
jgi:hypothetical protein